MRKLKLDELNRLSISDYKASDKIDLVVVLDNIRSAQNVGSIFRTADCFGIQSIFLCGLTPVPPHKEITKTAIGATHTVDWIQTENTAEAIKALKTQGFTITGIEQTTSSVNLAEFKPSNKTAIVMGNEVEGISSEILPLLDHCIELRQFGTKHSFNVSVCAGIVLYDLSWKIRSKS